MLVLLCPCTLYVLVDNESALAYAVAMEPVQVAVKADLPSFQLYKNGVYDDSNCTDIGIDHSMLLIGYGTTDKGVAYWILKNSWGESGSCDTSIMTVCCFRCQLGYGRVHVDG